MSIDTEWTEFVEEVKESLVGGDYLTKVLEDDYIFDDYIPLCEAVIAEKLGLTKLFIASSDDFKVAVKHLLESPVAQFSEAPIGKWKQAHCRLCCKILKRGSRRVTFLVSNYRAGFNLAHAIAMHVHEGCFFKTQYGKAHGKALKAKNFERVFALKRQK